MLTLQKYLKSSLKHPSLSNSDEVASSSLPVPVRPDPVTALGALA